MAKSKNIKYADVVRHPEKDEMPCPPIKPIINYYVLVITSRGQGTSLRSHPFRSLNAAKKELRLLKDHMMSGDDGWTETDWLVIKVSDIISVSIVTDVLY